MFKSRRSWVIFSVVYLAGYLALCAVTEFRWRDLVLFGFMIVTVVVVYRGRSTQPPDSN